MYPVPVVFKHQSDLFSGATTSVSLGKLFKKYPSLGHIPGDSDSVCLVQSPGILFSKKKKKWSLGNFNTLLYIVYLKYHWFQLNLLNSRWYYMIEFSDKVQFNKYSLSTFYVTSTGIRRGTRQADFSTHTACILEWRRLDTQVNKSMNKIVSTVTSAVKKIYQG